MPAPLSHKQKAYLAQLAGQAYDLVAKAARDRGQVFADSMEDFRHREVAAACGKLGLRCCSQDDYADVKAHFLSLLGRDGAAFKAHVHGATNSQRVVEFKIIEACRRFGLNLAYADKICRNQNHGAGLQDVAENRLWNVLYTINNRGNARRRKQSMEMAT